MAQKMRASGRHGGRHGGGYGGRGPACATTGPLHNRFRPILKPLPANSRRAAPLQTKGGDRRPGPGNVAGKPHCGRNMMAGAHKPFALPPHSSNSHAWFNGDSRMLAGSSFLLEACRVCQLFRFLAVIALSLGLAGCFQTRAGSPMSRRATRNSMAARCRIRRWSRNPSATRSIIAARKSPAPSSSIPGPACSTSCLRKDKAIRYGVAVGDEAYGWTGTARIARRAEWPSWNPTQSMARALARMSAPCRAAP